MMYLDDKEWVEIKERVDALERENRALHRTITGMKNNLKIAADYKNDDADLRLNGVQAALGRAASYEGRIEKRGKRRESA